MQQPSPLNEIIKADVEEITQSLLKDTVEPWIFFGSHGIHIKKIDGRSISISGVEYSGSAVTVFWEGFADAYIKKRSRELIEGAGVTQELGLRVCIVKDQYGFILHHRVMQNETDDKIVVPIIEEAIRRYSDFRSCSFDKGFHSPENQEELAAILDKVILPRKGRLSAINKEIEQSEEFIHAKHKHSAVESSINALENHGLDRCLDHGIHGFKRYVALAIVARNIQIVGDILQQKKSNG
jgi:hypothetical protein